MNSTKFDVFYFSFYSRCFLIFLAMSLLIHELFRSVSIISKYLGTSHPFFYDSLLNSIVLREHALVDLNLNCFWDFGVAIWSTLMSVPCVFEKDLCSTSETRSINVRWSRLVVVFISLLISYVFCQFVKEECWYPRL